MALVFLRRSLGLAGLAWTRPWFAGKLRSERAGHGQLGGRSPFPSPVPSRMEPAPHLPHADGLMGSRTLEGKLVLTSTPQNAPVSERLGTP